MASPQRLCTALLLVGLVGCTTTTPPSPPPPAPPAPTAAPIPVTPDRLSIVTTSAPFPRGLALHNDDLFVLSRGRVRDAGGTDLTINDLAGTIWKVSNPTAQPETTPLASPTAPPFRLLDRSLPTALDDTQTDRPYCILRFDPATHSFYFCAFSGIDKPLNAPGGYFRKNHSDAILRFDLRTMKFYELARATSPDSPLNGPNNCLVVGKWLYVVNKETSTLIRYDLSAIARSPDAPAGPPQLIAGKNFLLSGIPTELLGHSTLALGPDGYLYLGFRTSSAIIRIAPRDLRPHRDPTTPIPPIPAQLIAQFEPYNPTTPLPPRQADLTDTAFGPDGSLYVIGAKPARIWRLLPNPAKPLIATQGSEGEPAWAELHTLTANPKMKIESLTVDRSGNVFVTSSDKLPPHANSGLAGTVYRITP